MTEQPPAGAPKPRKVRRVRDEDLEPWQRAMPNESRALAAREREEAARARAAAGRDS